METEGACAILEPLSFPTSSSVLDKFSFAPWEAGKCFCPLCEIMFDLSTEKDFLYAHLYTVHKLIVSDAHLITSTKGYFDYWKVRFSQQPLSCFCTVISMEEEKYYFLSDAHPEDLELRRGLANKRLEWVLEYQKKEREDRSYTRGCLFCRYIEKSSRFDYLTHLSYNHNFQLGRPDNLVFIDQLINKLEEKFNKLECIYCGNAFKDRMVLKEHMRKKFHKRINPKNKEYDPFYVINYLEGGRQNEPEEQQPHDSWSQWREEGSDWSDWQEEPSPIVCLFCTFTCGEWEDIIQHMSVEHNFNYGLLMGKLNFYEQIKIVNYIRREIHLCRCYECKLQLQSREELLRHMDQLHHFTLPNRKDWNHPEFFFPTYENDTFLCLLEDNEDDPVEKLSSQLLQDCNITTDLQANGFPLQLIEHKIQKQDTPPPRDEKVYKSSITIPYHKGLSEKIRRIANNMQIRDRFRSTRTLRIILTQTKPKNEAQQSRNCVYEIPCQCGKKYIGETGRPLQSRLQEHQRMVRQGDTARSRIADHVITEQHRMLWDQARIILKEPRATKRKLKEATAMALADNPLSQPSLEINRIWLPLLRRTCARQMQ